MTANVSHKSLPALFAKVVIAIGIAVPGIIWEAYCLTVLWRWYAPEALGYFPLKAAIGVILMWGIVGASRRDDPPEIGHLIWDAVTVPATALLLGWIILWVIG